MLVKLRNWNRQLKILSLDGRALFMKKFVISKLLFKLSCITIFKMSFWQRCKGSCWTAFGMVSIGYLLES